MAPSSQRVNVPDPTGVLPRPGDVIVPRPKSVLPRPPWEPTVPRPPEALLLTAPQMCLPRPIGEAAPRPEVPPLPKRNGLVWPRGIGPPREP